MPVTFTIKNKRKFLGYQEVLSVATLIQLTPDLSQYSFDNSVENVDLFNARLSDVRELWLGVEGKSSLGFKLSYDIKSNEYQVVLSLYADEIDWKITLRYLSELAKLLDNPIKLFQKKYSADKIINYDFNSDLLNGVEELLKGIEDHGVVTLYGLKRPIVFGTGVQDIIKNSLDKIRTLGAILYNTQYPQAYVHLQTFHYNNGGKTIYGNYSIGEELKVVLPSIPFVEMWNNYHLVGHPLTHWTLTVTKLNEEGEYRLHKVFEYDSFIKNIPDEKCTYIDDNFMIVEKLTWEELEKISERAIELDRYGQFNN